MTWSYVFLCFNSSREIRINYNKSCVGPMMTCPVWAVLRPKAVGSLSENRKSGLKISTRTTIQEQSGDDLRILPHDGALSSKAIINWPKQALNFGPAVRKLCKC
ncbi:hypothetical protein ATANTOWER_005052 [Ataeniobius toweri]|uniref:Uncharacterized protein n=1 Tax=Ataeniobius toweri TaxID=208326 RepID=A0ABU7BQU7_9TELE|nr:hypothetical protein [Ataeniobius toweri]